MQNPIHFEPQQFHSLNPIPQINYSPNLRSFQEYLEFFEPNSFETAQSSISNFSLAENSGDPNFAYSSQDTISTIEISPADSLPPKKEFEQSYNNQQEKVGEEGSVSRSEKSEKQKFAETEIESANQPEHIGAEEKSPTARKENAYGSNFDNNRAEISKKEETRSKSESVQSKHSNTSKSRIAEKSSTADAGKLQATVSQTTGENLAQAELNEGVENSHQVKDQLNAEHKHSASTSALETLYFGEGKKGIASQIAGKAQVEGEVISKDSKNSKDKAKNSQQNGKNKGTEASLEPRAHSSNRAVSLEEHSVEYKTKEAARDSHTFLNEREVQTSDAQSGSFEQKNLMFSNARSVNLEVIIAPSQNLQHATTGLASSETPASEVLSNSELLDQLRSHFREQLNSDIVRQARYIFRGGNSGEINLILKPERFGKVKIRMNLEDKSVGAKIFVENKEVQEVFTELIADLRTAFEEQGYENLTFDITDNSENERSLSQEGFVSLHVDEQKEFVQLYIPQYDYVNILV